MNTLSSIRCRYLENVNVKLAKKEENKKEKWLEKYHLYFQHVSVMSLIIACKNKLNCYNVQL